jgi:hypothetical protein
VVDTSALGLDRAVDRVVRIAREGGRAPHEDRVRRAQSV